MNPRKKGKAMSPSKKTAAEPWVTAVVKDMMRRLDDPLFRDDEMRQIIAGQLREALAANHRGAAALPAPKVVKPRKARKARRAR